jgi:hypothetical protein
MEPTQSVPEQQPETAPAPPMSLAARLLNVFAVPGEVFADVKASPPASSNWLFPTLLASLVGILAAIIMFSQPAIQQQIREQQSKAIEERVKEGKMSQADADKAQEAMDKFMGPTLLKVSGGVMAVVISFARVLWWAFVLWLMAKWFLKTPVTFGKSMEVVGLALMISVLGGIVALLLIVNLGKINATPSLGFVIDNFDFNRKGHLFLGAANLFSFWQVGVIALGLAKLAGVPFLRAAWLVCFYWLIQECLLISSGLGQFAL